MFGKLKDKLKGALSKFSKEVEEEAEVSVEESNEQNTEDSQAEPSKQTTEKEQVSKEKSEDDDLDADEKVKEEVKDLAEEKISETKDEENAEELVEEEAKAEANKQTIKAEPSAQNTEFPSKQTTEEEKIEEVLETKQETTDTTTVSEKKFLGGLFSRKKEEAKTQANKQTIKAEPSAQNTEFPSKQTTESQSSEQTTEVVPEKKVKKESFFGKLTRISLTEEKFEELFWELELVLLENNVAVEVIEKIKEDLKNALTGEKASRKGVEELIKDTLKNTISEILHVKTFDLLARADEANKKGKPLVIVMIGVNGSGKTTTLAKLIHYFQQHNKSIVVAAADTFRAAAIQQLEEHTTKLGVKLIKHDYNADPAAVAYDAVKHARAKALDIVLIDSAGRLHSNDNLMEELKKLIRINTPDIKLFVGEAITGNDCVEQARLFNEAVGIDGIILAKADVDEKGGAAISASFITGKPILFLGTGQGYEDLQAFSAEKIVRSLEL